MRPVTRTTRYGGRSRCLAGGCTCYLVVAYRPWVPVAFIGWGSTGYLGMVEAGRAALALSKVPHPGGESPTRVQSRSQSRDLRRASAIRGLRTKRWKVIIFNQD